jgi:uncharacterized protein (TIGR02147 family)
MMLTDSQDYRALLKDELEKRCKKNTRYSLRAFARDLGVSSARLSLVLAGKGGLSVERAHKIARILGLNETEREHFATLVEATHGRSAVTRELATVKLRQFEVPVYQQIQADAFRVISDWYHYAILELTVVDGFKPDPAWISKALGIAEMEAKLAVERLERLDLIEWKAGTLVAKTGFTASTDGIPSESLRKFHQQILNKASEAIVLQTVEERNLSSITLAFDRSKMPEAAERIRRFRREFDRDMAAPQGADSVYCLAIQFFDLTKGMKQ